MHHSLKSSEIRYRRLFEAARDGILILNAETLKITDVNPFMMELLDYPRSAFLGKELWELGFFDDKDASKAAFDEVRANGYMRHDDLPLKTRAGKVRDVEFVSNVYNEDGKQVIQCNIRDITGRTSSSQIVRTGPPIIMIGIAALLALTALEVLERLLSMYLKDDVASGVQVFLGALAAAGIGYFALKNQDRYHRRTLEVVAQRRKAELMGHTSEAKYRELVENAVDMIYTVDMNGNFTSVNKASETIAGYSREEAMTMNTAQLVAPEYMELAAGMIAAKLAGKDIPAYEIEIINKAGRRVALEVSTRVVYDENIPVGIQGTARDITDRRRAENERRIISEIIEGAVITSDLDEFLDLVHGLISRLVYAENCFVMLKDPETDSVRFEFWVDLRDAHPEPKILGRGFASYIMRSGVPLRLTRDTRKRLVDEGEAEQIGSVSASFLGVPLRTPSSIIGVLVLQHYENEDAYSERDLDFLTLVGDQIALAIERRRIEEELRKSEESYRDVVENATDIIYTHDIAGNYTSVNEALLSVTGYTRKQALRMNLAGIVAPEYLNKAQRLMAAKLAGDDVPAYDLEILAKDGSRLTVEVNTRVIYENGVATGIQGIARDITDRKQAETALENSEASFRSLFDNSNDAILVVNDGIFLAANRGAEILFGCGQQDLVGSSPVKFSPLLQPDGRPSFEAAVEYLEAAKNGVPQFFEWTHNRLDGTLFDAEVSLNRVEFRGETHVQGTVRDITERKRAENELQRQQTELRVLFDLMPAMIWFKDTNNRILRVNQRVADAAGLPVAEIEGRSSAEIYPNEAAKFFKDDQKVIRSGRPKLGYVESLPGPDGDKIWVETDKVPYFDVDGKPIGIVVMAQDVTERTNADAALRESNEKFRQLAENITDVFWIRSPDMHEVQYVSPAFEKVWGRPVESLYAEPEKWSEYIFHEDRERVKGAFDALTKEGQTLDIEYRIVRPDGEIRWVAVRGSQVRDIADKVIRHIGIVSDITERHQAAEELRESEQRLGEMLRNLELVSVMLDVDGLITYCNDYLLRLTGWKREEVMGRNWAGLFLPPEILPEIKNLFKAILANLPASWHYENEIVTRSGERRLIRFNNSVVRSPSGEIIGTASIGEDITDIKLTQQALTESKLRYYSLFENMLEGYAYCETIFDGDALIDFIYVEVNGAFEKLTGLADVAGKRVSDVVPGLLGSNPTIFEVYGRVALTGKPEKFETYVPQLAIWLSVTVYSSNRTQFVAVFDNITERKRAQELLLESRQSLKLAAESAKLGIWDWDVVGNHLMWDAKMYELYGVREEDFSGAYDAWQTGLHPDDRERGDAEIHAALHGVKDFHTEFRVVLPGGGVRNIEAYADVLRSDDGTPIRMIGVNWDITQRRQFEDQFRQAQKMEAVGVLAGGIAHDFNNLLTAINGYSDLALRKIADDDPLRHHIQEIKRAGGRASELTTQLLAFSRKQVLKTRVYNLNTTITEIDKMLRRIMRENIELRTILAPDLGNIKADPGQIEQVIMNLAVNARDAMPTEGILTIETKNVDLDGEYISQLIGVSPGKFIKMTVSDTGEGIDEETQRHIFDPFYTTKDVGKGTGLGLATVYGIVKQSGGAITVYSEVGHGTTFKIYIPCVDQPVERPKWIDETEKYSGTETILLVEDEELVRNLVSEILTSNGYKVLAAGSSKEALGICDTHSGPIHLLLTDVIMPKMGGVALQKLVVKRLPDIKSLFMSGYTDDSITESDLLGPGTAFIEKPFTPDDLAEKVRWILKNSGTDT